MMQLKSSTEEAGYEPVSIWWTDDECVRGWYVVLLPGTMAPGHILLQSLCQHAPFIINS